MDAELLDSILTAYKKLRMEFHKLRNEIRRMYSNTKKSIKHEIKGMKTDMGGSVKMNRRVRGGSATVRSRNGSNRFGKLENRKVKRKDVVSGNRTDKSVKKRMNGGACRIVEMNKPDELGIVEVNKLENKNETNKPEEYRVTEMIDNRNEHIIRNNAVNIALIGCSARGNKDVTETEKEGVRTKNRNSLGSFMKMLQEETE